jgi:fatty acid desaturase
VRSTKGAIRWYRTPLDRETLAGLNRRSDAKGLAQALGHLTLLTVTGSASIVSATTGPLWATVLLLFLHGTVGSFMINAVHELVHRSVFRTPWLNDMFLRIYAFFGWINFEHFHASHMRHHQYTLHPPDDLEVVLPIRLMARQFFLTGFINLGGGLEVLRGTVRLARGKFQGEWERRLFPPERPQTGRPVIRRARRHLAGHAGVAAVSFALGWWMVPALTSLLPFYGGWLFFLCNNTQHVGLQDNVPDFRLCCRTFTVNPVVRFLYWHMNYHTEHHMYAAVPCYSLGALHRAILHDLPPCPRGLFQTWKEIAAILRRQSIDPTYQHPAPLPAQRSDSCA